ncbi:MAG TPA: hypothetical protein VM764_06000 [Gemmatimonadaceae bacterium]|nr:hypothetical protein [Gemmatimonadaceae bacterium]
MTDTELTPDERRRLDERISELPESVEPARDLWPAIRARIESARMRTLPVSPDATRTSATTSVGGTRTQSPRHSRTAQWARLATAAAALVVASVSLTWLALRGGSRDDGASAVAATTTPGSPAITSAALATFASYERSAADLADALEKRSARLDPKTQAVLERSLRTIDEALQEAREALAADPSSAAYRSFVESAYRQKLDFLRRANDVAALRGA